MNNSLIKATRIGFKGFFTVLCAMGGLIAASTPAMAADVWTGPLLYFTNFTATDVDRITPSVWITRGATRGLYNVAGGVENHYTHSLSPIGTEWAFGELSDYSSLNYNTWEGWFGGAVGGGPPSTVGKDAVLHIISEDVYIGVTFTWWSAGGGGFAYARTTPSVVPEPCSAAIVAAGVGVALYRRKRRFPF